MCLCLAPHHPVLRPVTHAGRRNDTWGEMHPFTHETVDHAEPWLTMLATQYRMACGLRRATERHLGMMHPFTQGEVRDPYAFHSRPSGRDRERVYHYLLQLPSEEGGG